MTRDTGLCTRFFCGACFLPNGNKRCAAREGRAIFRMGQPPGHIRLPDPVPAGDLTHKAHKTLPEWREPVCSSRHPRSAEC